MIYEIHTSNLKTDTVTEYLARFGEKLYGRLELSSLGGVWYTEVGPLNQVVAIWPYEDLDQMASIRERAEAGSRWPPDTRDLVVDATSEIYLPAPFMRPLGARDLGPIYDMRQYTYPPEDMGKLLKAWGERTPAREKLSPMAGCWYNEAGGRNNFVHLWAYRSFEERLRIRQEAKDKGVWPPPSDATLIRQENKVLLPAPFSPLQ